MNMESVMQNAPEGATPTSGSDISDESVSISAKAPRPRKPASAKAVSTKAATQPKAAPPAVAAQSGKTEKATKSVGVKKSPAKAPSSPIETDAVVSPKADKVAKVKKQASKKPKLVRDSFTIPESDYALFAVLKHRAITAGIEIKKGELLRAGILMLNSLSDAAFVKAIGLVERIKTGRPKK